MNLGVAKANLDFEPVFNPNSKKWSFFYGTSWHYVAESDSGNRMDLDQVWIAEQIRSENDIGIFRDRVLINANGIFSSQGSRPDQRGPTEFERRMPLDRHGLSVTIQEAASANDSAERVAKLRDIAIRFAIKFLDALKADSVHSQDQLQHWRFIDRRTGAISDTGYPIGQSGYLYKIEVRLKDQQSPHRIVV
jgi:hypothetical protein